MSAARPVAHASARISRRRPPVAVILARWTIVLSAIVVAVTIALALSGVIGQHAAPAAPYRPLGVCVVVAHAVNGGGVMCADGTVRP